MMISTVPTDETGRPIRPGVNGMIMKRQTPAAAVRQLHQRRERG